MDVLLIKITGYHQVMGYLVEIPNCSDMTQNNNTHQKSILYFTREAHVEDRFIK